MAHAPRDCTILMVDDEEMNPDLLEGILRGEGYHSLVRTTDARQAVPLFESCAPDLVLLDLHMPHLDGFQVLRQIRARTAEDDYLPVLVLTADITAESKERALSGGARDFLTKPLDVVEVLLRVHNLLEARLLHRHQKEARERAEALAAENARLFAEAQQATRARDRMLSVVAHDLRNPLAVVAMNAEMMLELLPPDTDPYQRDTLDVICQASGRMQRLVEDLLDVSRIEHGSFTLQRDDHSVRSLFAEAGRLLRPQAEARAIALEFAGSEGLPPLHVDAARVIQVLGNLVGNAIKFTPEGGRVSVGCAPAGDHLEITVADTGPGIPADQVPHLFDAFWQAREDDRRGIGLGLWIARSVVESHGGSIRVESVEGEGTTFRFTLPHAPPVEGEDPGAVRQTVPVPALVTDRVTAS
jgi:signal transduction histidine kinase